MTYCKIYIILGCKCFPTQVISCDVINYLSKVPSINSDLKLFAYIIAKLDLKSIVVKFIHCI